MTELSPLPDPALKRADDAVETAFAAARDSGWSAEMKAPLWQAGIEAVLAYGQAGADAPRARGYHHLVVDLAPEDGDWPDEIRRAVRLAAERTLMAPGKPHHRGRAKGLLRRIEAMENPVRAGRERALVAIAHALQSLSRQALDATGTDERVFRLQAQQQWLSRFSEALRGLPLDSEAPARVEAMLNDTLEMLEAGSWQNPASEPAMYELLQALRAPERTVPVPEAAFEALSAVRHAVGPLNRVARLELLAMVLDLDLVGVDPDGLAGMALHLASLAHMARQLGEMPADALPGLLLRLRLRLQGRGEPAFEPVIEAAVHQQEVLSALRVEAQALLAAVEAEDWDADEKRQERLRYQRQVRETGQLLDALRGLKLGGAPRSAAPMLVRLLHDLGALGAAHTLEPTDFEATLNLIVRQLENPALSTHRVWLAGQRALIQLAGQRRSLAEQVRGVMLDRHVDPAGRRERQTALHRHLDELDHVRQGLASLPLHRIGPEREADALDAVQAITLGVRRLVGAGDREAWRLAMRQAAEICS
ncbi:hypothetical protein D3C72_896110 [compost metagenome]